MISLPEHIASDLVLIQPTRHLNKVGDWVLYDIHDTSHHLTVKGKVLMLPQRLTYTGHQVAKYIHHPNSERMIAYKQHLNNRSMEFDTDIEVHVDDDVVFRYVNHIECRAQGWWWPTGDNENPALLVPYDNIFMAVRDQKQIMTNGYIWVEPILWTKDEVVQENEFVKENAGQRKTGVGIVKEIGSCNRHYLYERRADFDSVKVGDVILFKKTAGITAEWYYHKTLNEGRFPNYVMQRKDILAINNNLKSKL
ncbi:MAG: hypothetical protein K0U41_03070 [Gammaproteobacteria bacterium]|nr:hypothetical protein [Gammaproteobacteria bacterium]